MDEVWMVVRWLHLLAMAFVVGGQLVLAAAVVPVRSSRVSVECPRDHTVVGRQLLATWPR